MATPQHTLTRTNVSGLLCATLLLVILVSCGVNYVPLCCRHSWKYENAGACIPCLDSSRIILIPNQPSSTLQFEIIRDIHGYHMYVSTICYVLADCCGSQEEVPLQICVGEDVYDFEGKLYQGGQRVLIPEEARDIIIGGLLSGSCVTFHVGIYSVNVTSASFGQCWNRLIK
ncbi:MAG: hypothetical protein Q8K75_11885 [Chlamydiales bacterium]|nr:hypothetical protein [Chlamydiales bacterium]